MHIDDHVQSPCINVCTVGADGFCMGCKRTTAEIAYWPHMTSDEKRTIIGLLEARHHRETEEKPRPSPIPGSK